MTLKLSTMHLTNGVTFEFNGKDYFATLCKDRDYFLHFKRIGTNLQNDYKDRDQNAYSLFRNMNFSIRIVSFHTLPFLYLKFFGLHVCYQ